MKINIALRVGLVTGVLSAATVQIAFALFDSVNTSLHWGIQLSTIRGIVGLFSIVILGIGIYVGMNKTRRANDGVITWRQAVLTGIIIASIIAVIAASGAVIFNYLNPNFSERAVNEKEFSPGMLVFQAFTGQLVAGILISLIMAAFVRRKSGR